MERKGYLAALALIFALGAYLRLVDLAGPSLWLDEILHLDVTRSLAGTSWSRFLLGVREIKDSTENGALYYGFQLLGQSLAPGDLGVRLLPALIGTLTLPLMALTGQLVGGRLMALAATFLLAVSPLHVYFSREGRPYYLLMALALVLLYSLLRCATTEGSRVGNCTAWAGCLLGAYVGLHAVPLLASFLALALAAMIAGRICDRERATPWLRSPFLHSVAAAAVALTLAFGLYMTRSTMNMPTIEKGEAQVVFQESPVFESPLSERSRQRFLASMTTSGHPAVLLGTRSWLLIALAVLGVLGPGSWRLRDASPLERISQRVFVLGMFVLPALLSVVALLAVGRWYGIRYTASAQPAFLLLAAAGVLQVARLSVKGLAKARLSSRLEKRTPMVVACLVVLILLLLVAPNIEAALEHPQRKLDWREIAEFFDQVALPGEPIVVPNDWPKICLDYYLKQRGREVEFISIWETAARGDAVVAERATGWLLTAGYRKSNEARAWMHQFVPILKRSEEEMALFFFPDLVTLLETRFEADRGALFEQQFERMGRRFDFGGGETTLQGPGWSYPENDGAGTDFQWALGEEAQLGLPAGAPRSSIIRLRAQPFTFPGAAQQAVEIWLNDNLLGSLALLEGWSEHEIEAPASAFSSGANILYLRFSRSNRVKDVIEGAGDRRSLSAAFDFLEVIPN